MSRYLELKKRALLMAANQWFIPQGLDWAHCLAAYQFKGVGARKDAVIDLTSHGYDLTLSSKVEWSEANGITGVGDGLVKQADLAQQNVVTTIIRYSGYAIGDGWVPNNQCASRMKWPFPMLRMIVSFKGHGSDDAEWQNYGGEHVGLYYGYSTGSVDPSGDYTRIKYAATSVTPGSKGVLTWVKTGAIYKNEDLIRSAGTSSHDGWPGATPKIEESNQPLVFFSTAGSGSVNYLAAAFYDIALTESQIQDVVLAINNF